MVAKDSIVAMVGLSALCGSNKRIRNQNGRFALKCKPAVFPFLPLTPLVPFSPSLSLARVLYI